VQQVSFSKALVLSAIVLVFPGVALAQDSSASAQTDRFSASVEGTQQSNVPAPARQAEQAVERTVRRFRVGVEGGVGVDPELIMFGAHGTFGPIFTRGVDFRPGLEIGVGEVTTLLGINLDVLYSLTGTGRPAGWAPYIGAGPNLTLSHRGFEATPESTDDRNRFDFSDTDFEGGFNFIAGARHRSGMFLEMKATAYGVSNVRLLVGYNF
jgi:hypothetical protein